MLADCYGINKVILVERKSYKLKADRSLRQKDSLTLEQLRIDSKVFQNPIVQKTKLIVLLYIFHFSFITTPLPMPVSYTGDRDMGGVTKGPMAWVSHKFLDFFKACKNIITSVPKDL